MPDNEAGFFFPEYFHGVVYALCWLVAGLALGAFEEKATNSKNLLETIQRTAFNAAATVWLATYWCLRGGGGVNIGSIMGVCMGF